MEHGPDVSESARKLTKKVQKEYEYSYVQVAWEMVIPSFVAYTLWHLFPTIRLALPRSLVHRYWSGLMGLLGGPPFAFNRAIVYAGHTMHNIALQ